MDILKIITGFFLIIHVTGCNTSNKKHFTEQYNVVWDTQSINSGESMPCGGGDIGLNVWVENNELLFYIGKGGIYDENNSLLKLGRVRLQFNPNPFKENGQFRQELKLKEGYVEIWGLSPDKTEAKIRIWVEVHRPVIHIDINSKEDISVSAVYEYWRDKPMLTTFRRGCSGLGGSPSDERNYKGDIYTWPDSVNYVDGNIIFSHKNRNDKLTYDLEMDLMALSEYKSNLYNPLEDLTFGGLMKGDGFIPDKKTAGVYYKTNFTGWKLTSEKKRKAHELSIYLHTSQTETGDQWKNELLNLVKQTFPTRNEAWNSNVHWWNDFWDRSYIILNPETTEKKDSAWVIGQRYQLFRYMLGCNAFGKDPTKFNGGFFTVDPYYYETPEPTPDSRIWGGGSITLQNQRLVYWPMLKSGDFDLMHSQFDFFKFPIETAKTWVKHHWNHDGAYYCESLNNFGLPVGTAYHWNRDSYTAAPVYKHLQEPGLVDNKYLGFHYTGQVEFSYMILEYYNFTGEDISEWMPFVRESLKFINEHYKYLSKKLGHNLFDEKGKLVFFPSQSVETFVLAENPTDLIAGLKATLPLLLKLPENYLSDNDRAYFKEFLRVLPEISIENTRKNREGLFVKTIAPAKKWTDVTNMESPQLYPVYPYDIYGIGKPGLEIAQNTWMFSDYVSNRFWTACWFQYGIFAARLGMTDEAIKFLKAKFFEENMRFPAFWVFKGFDQEPDFDHGGAGMIILQEMLMQTSGDEIRLFPAWPKNWNVDFKLHAPNKTVVEGKLINGKIEDLKVTPAERGKNIIISKVNHP